MIEKLPEPVKWMSGDTPIAEPQLKPHTIRTKINELMDAVNEFTVGFNEYKAGFEYLEDELAKATEDQKAIYTKEQPKSECPFDHHYWRHYKYCPECGEKL